MKAIAAGIRTTERDDLESVLVIHLWQIKQRFGAAARDWKAFAARVLRNKAANWIRDRQLLESRLASLDTPNMKSVETETPLGETLMALDADADTQAALERVWDELDEDLRRAWTLLVEENGNQARVARRLGKHRNTLRLWIGRIEETLKRHGFST